MIEGIPKISVLIICYKQEELIRRALNSLLEQKDYIYEICVSDDCSPDNTWDVLLDYQRQYPELIKLHRNEPNVGIFENIEQSWTMPTGEVIYQMAGDDEAVVGYFESIVRFIQDKQIDYKNELFCIYGDFMVKYPNGDSIVYRNKAIEKYPNEALRLAIRSIITNRSTCYSAKILKLFDRVSQGRSHKVEHIQDRQIQINATNNYYINMVGNIYYAGVGVSAHLDENTRKERSEIWPFTFDYLKKKGITLCDKDLSLGDYNVAFNEFRQHRSLSGYLKLRRCRIKCKEPRYKGLGIGKRLYVFAILRRLPHKKPIVF